MRRVDYSTQSKSRAFLGTVLAAFVFYAVTVAFDLLITGKSWGEAMRSNIAPALLFAALIAVWFDLWPRWRAKRNRKDGAG